MGFWGSKLAVAAVVLFAGVSFGSMSEFSSSERRDIPVVVADSDFPPEAVPVIPSADIPVHAAPLPTAVGMGLLALTVCAASVCRRQRRPDRRGRA